MHSLFAEIEKYAKFGAVVLATIITHNGSAPRTSGARMLMLPGGEIKGTIGGGRYEAEAISLGLTMLESDQSPDGGAHPARLMFFPLNKAGDMDLICGGEVLVLLELIPAQATQSDACSQFAQAFEAERDGRGLVFASQLRFRRSDVYSPSSTFPAPEGSVERHLIFPAPVEHSPAKPEAAALPAGLKSKLSEALSYTAPTLVEEDGGIWLLEPFPARERLYLVGAGHVSVALARLAGDLDFNVTALDDRPEFANSARFPQAEVIVPASLAEGDLCEYFSRTVLGPRDAVIIVTRGHAFDRDALAAALRTQAGYIGMIGSASKRGQVYQSLREAGFADAALKMVHSPIGLAIGAETPEEIAVSIMAELIAWRRAAL